MKIVIACTSAGAGHLKAAETIYNYFLGKDPSQDLALVEILEESHFLFGNFYSRSYSFMVNHAQWLWRFILQPWRIKRIYNAVVKCPWLVIKTRITH